MTLLCKCAYTLKKCFTSEIVARFSFFFLYNAFHFGLRRDRCVISTRDPQRTKSSHAMIANQYVLYGAAKCVAHVEHTGHVWWGKDNGVWLCISRYQPILDHVFGSEVAAVFPFLVYRGFFVCRIVGLQKLLWYRGVGFHEANNTILEGFWGVVLT